MHFLFTLLPFPILALLTLISNAQIGPFYLFYYGLASYLTIFFLDGLNFIINKESLILSKTKDFFLSSILSIGVYFIFELINIRLKLWNYDRMPYEYNLRVFFYIISYSVILPTIIEIKTLFAKIKVFDIKLKSWNIKEKKFNLYLYISISIFILSLFLKSTYLFAWLSLFLTIDFINYKTGDLSFIRDLRAARWRALFEIISASIIFLLLHILYNLNSWIKIRYSDKLSYLISFPLIAMNIYALYNLYLNLSRKFSDIEKAYYHITLFLILLFISIVSIHLIDSYSVKTFIFLI
jgi:hypothetical protein